MKKKSKVTSPKDSKSPKLKGLASRIRKKEDSSTDTSVPRITNDSIEQHRKEVIKDGRKYVYPIINTPKRVVGLSLLVALISGLIFSGYILLQLYRFNSNSDFIYNVTRVIPLPVARVGGQFVPYEDYLFELRRFTHYFESQQSVDFESA